MAAKAEYGRVLTGVEAMRDKIKIDDSWKFFKATTATADLDAAMVHLTQVKNKNSFYNNLLTSRNAAELKKQFKTENELAEAVDTYLADLVDAVYNADTEMQLVNENHNSRMLVQANKAKAKASSTEKADAGPAKKQRKR